MSMLKIRRPLGRLIFNMGIAIPGKTVFLNETAPLVTSGFPVTVTITAKSATTHQSVSTVYSRGLCWPGWCRQWRKIWHWYHSWVTVTKMCVFRWNRKYYGTKYIERDRIWQFHTWQETWLIAPFHQPNFFFTNLTILKNVLFVHQKMVRGDVNVGQEENSLTKRLTSAMPGTGHCFL